MVCIMNLASKPLKEPLIFGHWMYRKQLFSMPGLDLTAARFVSFPWCSRATCKGRRKDGMYK